MAESPPHVAGRTVEARRELALSAAAQLLQVLRGEWPPHLVNPEVWEHVQRRVENASLRLWGTACPSLLQDDPAGRLGRRCLDKQIRTWDNATGSKQTFGMLR